MDVLASSEGGKKRNTAEDREGQDGIAKVASRAKTTRHG